MAVKEASNFIHDSKAILFVVAPCFTGSVPISSNNISVPHPPVVASCKKSSEPSNCTDFSEPVKTPSAFNPF